MAIILFLLLISTLFFLASTKLVEHTFQVQNLTVKPLCKEQVIIAVNGKYPGPTIHVREGDTLLVHVINNSTYGISIHWHGVFQLLSGWADGANYVTQCPILPGKSYDYKFNITGQEGTLWWHAHVSWLRATVHGAFIIHPTKGRSYPFGKPYQEVPIFLGDWWNANIVDIEDQFIHVSGRFIVADALTINGEPGDFYECSTKNRTYTLHVKQGKTYLLRIINVAINAEYFFKIANHKMIVVAVDATYTNPYISDVIVLAPGQTMDVLLKADQPPRSYYMAARSYASFTDKTMLFTNGTTSGIIVYEDATSLSSILPTILPDLPDSYDSSTVHNFVNSLRGLTSGPFWVPVPRVVDEHIFVTVGFGLVSCSKYRNPSNCKNRFSEMVFTSMNNVAFQLPTQISMLEAFLNNVSGIYTSDFPRQPPLNYDYTNPLNVFNEKFLRISDTATKVINVKYNTTIEIVIQNTVLVTVESHPIHLHGFNFFVLAQGLGNYDKKRDEIIFNLVNPQQRNTVAVPAGGWVVIRFQANNPGVWFFHCHLDAHVSTGLGTAIVVENGPTQSTTLPFPPFDFPRCDQDKNINGESGQLGR